MRPVLNGHRPLLCEGLVCLFFLFISDWLDEEITLLAAIQLHALLYTPISRLHSYNLSYQNDPYQ
jgi:hypothetical protein